VYYDALAATIKTPNTNSCAVWNKGEEVYGDMQGSGLSDKEPINCDDLEAPKSKIVSSSTTPLIKSSATAIAFSNPLISNQKEPQGTPNEISSCNINCEGQVKVKLNGNFNGAATDPSQMRDGISNISAAAGCEISMSTPSKIPVLTSSLRQSKCASWAGVVTTTPSTSAVQPVGSIGTYDLQNLPNETHTSTLDPIDAPNRAHHYVTGLQNSSNITDLTPGLFCMFLAYTVYS